MLKSLILIIGLCLLSALSAVLLTSPQVVENLPVPTADVCSENPYYAEAIVAMAWMGSQPSTHSTSGSAYSHAVLDSLYQSLLADGKVDPVPPPCTLTAQAETIVQSTPGAESEQVGILHTGETAQVYGRTEGGGWWNVLFSGGWGWVSTGSTVLQAGAELDLIPYH